MKGLGGKKGGERAKRTQVKTGRRPGGNHDNGRTFRKGANSLVERDGPVFNVVAELGGPNKGGLRDFIAHCREGGEIWIC